MINSRGNKKKKLKETGELGREAIEGKAHPVQILLLEAKIYVLSILLIS